MQQVRQGDVFLERVRTRKVTDTRLEERGRVILAHGEVTGHAHEVVDAISAPGERVPPASFFEAPDGQRYLLVDRACLLTHQEHGPISLAPGCYRVTRQREYSPEAIRTVAD